MLELLLVALLAFSAGCHRTVAPSLSTPPPVLTETPVDVPPGRTTVGNGADYFSPEHDSAWFLGRRSIRYCLEISSDFNVPAAKISEMVASAFRQWRSYLAVKRLNEPFFHPSRGRLVTDPVLALNSIQIEKCDGSQDLTLYFGAKDATVRRYLALYERPLAISERLSYDPKIGWGKGFLWFAKSGEHSLSFLKWERCPNCLATMVMHELGHVAGCGHVDKTVMDGNIAGRVEFLIADRFHLFGGWVNNLPLLSFLSVDGKYWGSNPDTRELLLCDNCGFEGSRRPTEIHPRIFFEMTGIYLRDDEKAVLFLDKKAAFARELQLRVEAYDGNGNKNYDGVFTVGNILEAATFADTAPVFKQVFQRPDTSELTTLTSYSRGVVYVGQIQTHAWQRMPIVIKRNTKTEALNIEALGEDGPYPIWIQREQVPYESARTPVN